eukprot:1003944_1
MAGKIGFEVHNEKATEQRRIQLESLRRQKDEIAERNAIRESKQHFTEIISKPMKTIGGRDIPLNPPETERERRLKLRRAEFEVHQIEKARREAYSDNGGRGVRSTTDASGGSVRSVTEKSGRSVSSIHSPTDRSVRSERYSTDDGVRSIAGSNVAERGVVDNLEFPDDLWSNKNNTPGSPRKSALRKTSRRDEVWEKKRRKFSEDRTKQTPSSSTRDSYSDPDTLRVTGTLPESIQNDTRHNSRNKSELHIPLERDLSAQETGANRRRSVTFANNVEVFSDPAASAFHSRVSAADYASDLARQVDERAVRAREEKRQERAEAQRSYGIFGASEVACVCKTVDFLWYPTTVPRDSSSSPLNDYARVLEIQIAAKKRAAERERALERVEAQSMSGMTFGGGQQRNISSLSRSTLSGQIRISLITRSQSSSNPRSFSDFRFPEIAKTARECAR